MFLSLTSPTFQLQLNDCINSFLLSIYLSIYLSLHIPLSLPQLHILCGDYACVNLYPETCGVTGLKDNR